MARHRWSNLVGLMKATTPGQRIKTVLLIFGATGIVSLLALGYFQPTLGKMMKGSEADPEKAASLQGISLGQDATFMGRVVQQQNEQVQQAAELKALKNANNEMREELQRALSQPTKKSDVSRSDVAEMINAQLASVRNAQIANQRLVVAPPPQPVLLSHFEPPSPAAATYPSAGESKPSSEPTTKNAVAIPAGSFAEGVALNGFLAQSTDQTESVTAALITDFSGPNGATIPMTACRVVAECEAKDLIARGRCEISVVTCTLSDNRLVDIPVSGWLTGGDNVNGSFGTVIWNDYELLKGMAQATLPGILSELLDLTETVVEATSPTGVVTSGTSSPLADVARDLSSLLLDRVRMFIFPIVAVDRDQRVNVYIRETAYVTGTTPQDWVPRPVANLDPYN